MCNLVHRVYNGEGGESFLVLVKVVDAETGEIVKTYEKVYGSPFSVLIHDHSVRMAYDLAREAGFDSVNVFDSNFRTSEAI